MNLAREYEMVLSIKGGAHNVAGNAVNDGGMVIDLSPMRGVHVDAARRTVRVQGGATLGDLDRETQLYGLAVPAGFWAVRGAGSNFGVVTSFEFQAHPVGPMVMVGAVFYPFEDARRLLPAWRDSMSSAPEELSSMALLWGIPPAEPFPPALQGKPAAVVAACYCGSVEDGEPVVQPLRELGEPLIDLSGPWPWLGLQSGFDALFPKGGFYYWKSRSLAELTDEAIDVIIDFGSHRPSPLSDIVVWHHGGAMSRVAETETAYGGRDAGFLVTGEASWDDPALSEDGIAWGRAFWDAMGPHSTGGLYLNFAGLAEENEELVRAGYGMNYDRLAALKAKYDPTNLFPMNLNIAPVR